MGQFRWQSIHSTGIGMNIVDNSAGGGYTCLEIHSVFPAGGDYNPSQPRLSILSAHVHHRLCGEHVGFLFAGRGRRNKRQLVAATYARAIIFSYHYSPVVGATERIQISRRQQGWGVEHCSDPVVRHDVARLSATITGDGPG